MEIRQNEGGWGGGRRSEEILHYQAGDVAFHEHSIQVPDKLIRIRETTAFTRRLQVFKWQLSLSALSRVGPGSLLQSSADQEPL